MHYISIGWCILTKCGMHTSARADVVDAAKRDGHAAAARHELALQVVQARSAPLNFQQPRRLLQPPPSFLRTDRAARQ